MNRDEALSHRYSRRSTSTEIKSKRQSWRPQENELQAQRTPVCFHNAVMIIIVRGALHSEGFCSERSVSFRDHSVSHFETSCLKKRKRQKTKIFTSLGPRRGVEWSVGNVRTSAGALATLVGLLLRVMHLHLFWINGGTEVYGSQGLIGASPLADQRGGGFGLLVAVIPLFSFVLWLALTWGLLLFFGVVLVPQTMALETEKCRDLWRQCHT